MKEKQDPALRVTLLPRDTNKHGTIFGGIILSHIDLAAAIEARNSCGPHNFVTVAMDKVVFHKPVFVGDVVSFYTDVVRVGRTSITMHVSVETDRDGRPIRLTEDAGTIVARVLQLRHGRRPGPGSRT